ncbi:MAG: alpha/beta fold hydrolase [Pseudomonadota bacterium]
MLSSGHASQPTLVLLHGNLAAATYFEDLMSSLAASCHCVAPDLRGYGDTEDLPIDATRGARDWSDDLRALLDALEIDAAHLLGWSAGAAGIMQFTIDHPHRVRSLTLVAPVSPFGFGGTCDAQGTPTHPDYAGSGAGIIADEVVQQLAANSRSADSPAAPLHLLRMFFVRPPLTLAREVALVDATLKLKLGEKRYPGDHVLSPHWPGVAPGQWGATNALSPKYFDVSGITSVDPKPPILWIRGDSDQIVSDQSMFDAAVLLPADAEFQYPSQPMVLQTRFVLDRYQASGGAVREVEMRDTGHSPFLEQPEAFSRLLADFIAEQRG